MFRAGGAEGFASKPAYVRDCAVCAALPSLSH